MDNKISKIVKNDLSKKTAIVDDTLNLNYEQTDIGKQKDFEKINEGIVFNDAIEFGIPCTSYKNDNIK